MRLEVKFSEAYISDGGYNKGLAEGEQIGYDKGYTQGDTDGQAKGKAEGKAEGEQIGYDNALSKLAALEVAENGQYKPTGDNIGFSSVDVNIPEIPTQEKSIDITENGTVEVIADEGHLLSKVTANVSVGGENKFPQLVDGSITEVTAEDLQGVTKIRSNAFVSTKLKSAVIPDSVTEIGYQAFYQVGTLTQMTIGRGIQSIGNYAFRETSLNRIKILATTPPTIQTNSLGGLPSACIFEVPADAVEVYKAATNWSAKADKIIASEEF